MLPQNIIESVSRELLAVGIPKYGVPGRVGCLRAVRAAARKSA
jgi:hypothetical protein